MYTHLPRLELLGARARLASPNNMPLSGGSYRGLIDKGCLLIFNTVYWSSTLR